MGFWKEVIPVIKTTIRSATVSAAERFSLGVVLTEFDSLKKPSEFAKKALSLQRSQAGFAPLFRLSGVPGFDSRQSLIVSTPSAVRQLVNPDAQKSNGDNSYALAA